MNLELFHSNNDKLYRSIIIDEYEVIWEDSIHIQNLQTAVGE